MAQAMQELDLEGLFWPSTSPEAQVAGRLRFDVSRGGELDLIGSFGGPESLLANEGGIDGIRLHGVAGKRLLTLDGCWRSGSNFEAPGIQREQYRIRSILSGAQFEADEALEFISVSVELRHLEHWIGKTGLSFSLNSDPGSKEISNVQIVLDPAKKTSFPATEGQVELGFTWELFGDEMVEKGLRHGAYITFRPKGRLPLEVLMKMALAIQHLVTLGVDASAPLSSVTFKHETRTRTLGSGKSFHETIELFAQLQGGDSAPPRGVILPHQMLFTFADLGGLHGLAQWFDVVARFEPVIGTLLSHRYMSRMYMENRLQNAVFAAETFHRIRFPNQMLPQAEFRIRVQEVLDAVPIHHKEWIRKELEYSNEPRLRDRLLELAEYAGATFAILVGDVRAWASLVRDARNRSVHRDSGRKPASGEEMFFLSEAVYFLVSICLLREGGVSEEALLKMRDHRRFVWLKDQFARASSNP